MKKKKKKRRRKENRACRYNGAETRKGEANDISWTIVLWAATVAAIISRLTLLFPWRRYGFRIEGHIEVHRLPREDGRWNGREVETASRPYGTYTQTTYTWTTNTRTTTKRKQARKRETNTEKIGKREWVKKSEREKRKRERVCSRCSRDGIRERGCMLGIRKRGHYKELWGPASYVNILASASLATFPSIHPASFYLSLPTASPSPSLRGCGSLYTRSVAVLNVLSLLMPRSVCPRGRTTNISVPAAFFFVWPDIELYAARIYRSKFFCKRLRRRKKVKHEEE